MISHGQSHSHGDNGLNWGVTDLTVQQQREAQQGEKILTGPLFWAPHWDTEKDRVPGAPSQSPTVQILRGPPLCPSTSLAPPILCLRFPSGIGGPHSSLNAKRNRFGLHPRSPDVSNFFLFSGPATPRLVGQLYMSVVDRNIVSWLERSRAAPREGTGGRYEWGRSCLSLAEQFFLKPSMEGL